MNYVIKLEMSEPDPRDNSDPDFVRVRTRSVTIPCTSFAMAQKLNSLFDRSADFSSAICVSEYIFDKRIIIPLQELEYLGERLQRAWQKHREDNGFLIKEPRALSHTSTDPVGYRSKTWLERRIKYLKTLPDNDVNRERIREFEVRLAKLTPTDKALADVAAGQRLSNSTVHHVEEDDED